MEELLMYRVIFVDDAERDEAEEALEEEGRDYDYDSGNRMMISQDGLDFLDECGFDFEEV